MERFPRALPRRATFGGEIDVDEHGEPIVGDTLLLMFNADHANTIPFVFPKPENGNPWELVFDTARPEVPWGCIHADGRNATTWSLAQWPSFFPKCPGRKKHCNLETGIA